MQILSYINITNPENNLREFAEENLQQQMHINSLASDIAKLSSHEETKERIHTNLTSVEASFKNQDEELKIVGLIQQFYANYLSYSKWTIEVRQKYGYENAAAIATNTAVNTQRSAAAASQGSAAMEEINASAVELASDQLRSVVNEFKI